MKHFLMKSKIIVFVNLCSNILYGVMIIQKCTFESQENAKPAYCVVSVSKTYNITNFAFTIIHLSI